MNALIKKKFRGKVRDLHFYSQNNWNFCKKIADRIEK